MSKKKNFSWLANTFNSMLANIGAKMTTNLDHYSALYQNPNRVGNTLNYLNQIQLDPQLYCDIMNDFSYFNALVNVFADAAYEVIANDQCQIVCKDKALEIQINNAIQRYKLKDYILKHLHECFKRGSFVGLISDTEITDILTPYDNEFLMKKGKLLSTYIKGAQVPFYDTFNYWFNTKIKNAFTVEEVKQIKKYSHKTEVDHTLEDIAEKMKSNNAITQDNYEEKKLLQQFKECIELDTTILIGDSYFTQSLLDIFRIYIRDYILDSQSLSAYLKSECITVSANANKIANEKVIEIINNIEALLNADNINVLTAYNDPLQFINQINDKSVNKYKVVPEIKEYAEIKELAVPDTAEQLKALQEDIKQAKQQVEDDLKIPADIFTGNGNRWELSSKYEEYTNTLSHFLKTVSDSISRFCVAIAYRMTGNYYDVSTFTHKFDIQKYISPYAKSNRVSQLNDKISDLNTLLGSISDIMENPAVDQTKFVKYIQQELKEADPALQAVLSDIPFKYTEDTNNNKNQSNKGNVNIEIEEGKEEPENEEIEEPIEEPEENIEETSTEEPQEVNILEDIGTAIL